MDWVAIEPTYPQFDSDGNAMLALLAAMRELGYMAEMSYLNPDELLKHLIPTHGCRIWSNDRVTGTIISNHQACGDSLPDRLICRWPRLRAVTYLFELNGSVNAIP